MQQAAKQATPQLYTGERTSTISRDIKELIIAKRQARLRWHRSHFPADKTTYNRLTNQLKSKLKATQDKSFQDYIHNLNRYDNSIWRSVKATAKPTQTNPPIRKNDPTPGPWARSNQEKADLFAEHLAEVFSPHNAEPNQEIYDYLNTNLGPTDPIQPVTPKEIKAEISRLNTKKSPGVDQITPKMLKELPKKAIVMLTYIFNAILRLQYWPQQFKIAEIILIAKPGKNPNHVSSYRPISLLSTISKVLEKLLLCRINLLLDVIPDHQFGFRHQHSTLQQCHRVTQVINKSLEDKKYCSSVFLDISQAFDKVWHDGLLYKTKLAIPSYFKLVQSYLHNRKFQTKINSAFSSTFPIQAGVPQGSVLGPTLYLLYTSDLPTTSHTTIGTFADDTTILASHDDPIVASSYLQVHLNLIQQWFSKWRFKINLSKSTQVIFTLRTGQCPPNSINNVTFPTAPSVRYLGIHLDKKLNWKEHILKKKKQIDLRFKELNWLIGRKSRLSLENKILVYKTIIRPIWTYGIELWGCASKSNLAIIQRSQSKILRAITDAPWYVSNQMIHNDLNIPFVQDVIQHHSNKHHAKLELHTNPLIQPLLQHHNNRRLKRNWPIDLL